MPRQSTEKVNTPSVWIMRGSLAFPIDMLRYDSAHPYREEDSNTIARSVRHEGSEGADEVRVVMRGQPTEGRWKSFGWKVVGVIDRDGVVQRVSL